MIQIVENAVPAEVQNDIEDLCTSPFFGWHYHRTTVYEPDYDINQVPALQRRDVVDTPFFSHFMWNEFGCNSGFFTHMQPVIESMVSNIEDYRLIRLKVNLTTPHRNSTTNTHSYLHTDMPVYYPGDLTAVYYVNDSDGDTFIFNETGGHTGDVTIDQRISPKKGTLVVFDANRLHAGNNPFSSDCRIVVNINITRAENFQAHYDNIAAVV